MWHLALFCFDRKIFSIDIVMETTTTERERILHEETGEEQMYMASVVQLLAYCCQGDNKTVESICQTMFTLCELLDIILISSLCDGMRSPFVLFLNSVFFTSNLEVAEYELKVFVYLQNHLLYW